MNRFHLAVLSTLTAVAVSGCATTTVSGGDDELGNQQLPKPAQIVVFDFAATPDDIAAGMPEASLTGQPAGQTDQEVATGRKLGAQVAKELVSEIQAMGLPASGPIGVVPRPGDIVIKGYFDSIDQGSAAKRIILGFGSGAASLRTVVVGYQMTPRGLMRLGSENVDSAGNKTPGILVPLAIAAATSNQIGLVIGGAVKVAGEADGNDTIEGAAKRTAKEIAGQLKASFQKQGWIQ